jgi:hypothetical protein
MGRRWTTKEEVLISQVRKSLKQELANRPQFPEGFFGETTEKLLVFEMLLFQWWEIEEFLDF